MANKPRSAGAWGCRPEGVRVWRARRGQGGRSRRARRPCGSRARAGRTVTACAAHAGLPGGGGAGVARKPAAGVCLRDLGSGGRPLPILAQTRGSVGGGAAWRSGVSGPFSSEAVGPSGRDDVRLPFAWESIVSCASEGERERKRSGSPLPGSVTAAASRAPLGTLHPPFLPFQKEPRFQPY